MPYILGADVRIIWSIIGDRTQKPKAAPGIEQGRGVKAKVPGLLLFSIVFWIISSLKYKWEYYWLTNKRIIQRKGLIGHSISSVPYERISDVIISRSWLEKLLGIGSLRIQTLAGQISGRGRWGAEITMLALDNPEQIQSLIFSLVKKNIEKI